MLFLIFYYPNVMIFIFQVLHEQRSAKVLAHDSNSATEITRRRSKKRVAAKRIFEFVVRAVDYRRHGFVSRRHEMVSRFVGRVGKLKFFKMLQVLKRFFFQRIVSPLESAIESMQEAKKQLTAAIEAVGHSAERELKPLQAKLQGIWIFFCFV